MRVVLSRGTGVESSTVTHRWLTETSSRGPAWGRVALKSA
jgi:hypothetical protein